MPVITNHPLRLRRIRAGLSQKALADLSGVSRGAIAQLEEGRTVNPSRKLLLALARATRESPELIQQELDRWNKTADRAVLSPSGFAAIRLDLDEVRALSSWRAWREMIAPTPTGFASLLRIPRSTLVKYEADPDAVMPASLYRALAGVLHLSDAYLAELEDLHGRG